MTDAITVLHTRDGQVLAPACTLRVDDRIRTPSGVTVAVASVEVTDDGVSLAWRANPAGSPVPVPFLLPHGFGVPVARMLRTYRVPCPTCQRVAERRLDLATDPTVTARRGRTWYGPEAVPCRQCDPAGGADRLAAGQAPEPGGEGGAASVDLPDRDGMIHRFTVAATHGDGRPGVAVLRVERVNGTVADRDRPRYRVAVQDHPGQPWTIAHDGGPGAGTAEEALACWHADRRPAGQRTGMVALPVAELIEAASGRGEVRP